MPAKKKLTDALIQQAALLHHRGLPQIEIADRLKDLSQASVSRALDKAEKSGWLVVKSALTLSRARIEELEQMIHAPQLKKRLVDEQPSTRRHLRRLRILDCAVPASSQVEYKKAFGREVAQHLVDEVFPVIGNMGVTWGGTLLATVRGLDFADRTELDPEHEIQFFPVCGVPLYLNAMTKATSHSLVASFDKRLYEKEVNLLNFVDVGATVPRGLGEKGREVLYNYFRERVGYRDVFGDDGKTGLVEEMDAVVTSVSPPEDDPWIVSAASAGEMDPVELNACTYGNIGGIFLPRPNISAEQTTRVNDVNDCWTGIRLEHFVACAERAKRRRRGGTIVIAHGERAELVLECVRQGLVSELLLDPVCAKGLSKALDFHPEAGQP